MQCASHQSTLRGEAVTLRDNAGRIGEDPLTPYVPVLVDDPNRRVRSLDGTLVFADVSGFTKLSEKLAEQGKAGAEELTQILLGTFTDLLSEAHDEGGDLLSFGGDALLLAFVGDGHATRATRAAVRMRSALKARGPVQTGRGRVTLKISQGAHTGTFHLVLAGEQQRELLVIGPDATLVTDIEGAASAGQVVVSHATAAGLPDAIVGADIGPGLLVRRLPTGVDYFDFPVASELDRSTLVPAAVRRRAESGEKDAEHRKGRGRLRPRDGRRRPPRPTRPRTNRRSAQPGDRGVCQGCRCRRRLPPGILQPRARWRQADPHRRRTRSRWCSRMRRADCWSPPEKLSTTICPCRFGSAPTSATCCRERGGRPLATRVHRDRRRRESLGTTDGKSRAGADRRQRRSARADRNSLRDHRTRTVHGQGETSTAAGVDRRKSAGGSWAQGETPLAVRGSRTGDGPPQQCTCRCRRRHRVVRRSRRYPWHRQVRAWSMSCSGDPERQRRFGSPANRSRPHCRTSWPGSSSDV